VRVLVTGCRGTIGRPLMRELRARGHDAVGVDLDHAALPLDQYRRADIGEFRELMQAADALSNATRAGQKAVASFDLIVNLAAEFGRINGAEHYEKVWRTNCIGLRNVLEVAGELESQSGVTCRVLHASTSEIYGEPVFGNRETLGASELRDYGRVRDGDPPRFVFDEVLSQVCALRPKNDYAVSKLSNELQLHNWPGPWAAVRIFNAYGPGEVGNHRRSVVSQFIFKLLRRQTVRVYGECWRDAVFIDDLVDALCRFADGPRFADCRGRFINLAGGEYRSIDETFGLIATEVARFIGVPRDEIDKLGQRMGTEPGNAVHKEPSTKTATDLLGWKATTPFIEGLRTTVAWAARQLRLAPSNGEEVPVDRW
jgi:dTDP-glucose 4,6-dehydratase